MYEYFTPCESLMSPPTPVSPSSPGRTVSRVRLPVVTRDLADKVVTCEASNTDLVLPRHASLQLELVLAPVRLEVTSSSGLESLLLGSSLRLSCRVWGARPAPSISWRGDFLTQQETRYKVSSGSFIALFIYLQAWTCCPNWHRRFALF